MPTLYTYKLGYRFDIQLSDVERGPDGVLYKNVAGFEFAALALLTSL